MRVVIPQKLQAQLLAELHAEHQGMTRTIAFAQSYIWWPNMESDIQKMVAQCTSCQAVGNTPAKAPLIPWSWASRVWQRIHIDYAELKKHNMLIVYDVYSKWIEVINMTSTTSKATIGALRNVFAVHGLPEEIVSDNGPQFTSNEFRVFTQQNGIKHTLVPPYHPASNGAAERAVKTRNSFDVN